MKFNWWGEPTNMSYGKTPADVCAVCGHTRYVHIPDGGCDFDAHYYADPCSCTGFDEGNQR